MMRRKLCLYFAILVALAAAAADKPGFRVAGRIVNGLTGEPIAGAKVELGTTKGEEWVRVVRADSAGRFVFDGLRSGKYQLHGEFPGFYPKGFDQHDGGYMSAIVVGGAVDSEHLVFRLDPACSISGYITDEFNEPVREAQVFLFSRAVQNGKFSIHLLGQDRTDDRGHFLMSPIEAGTKYIVVSARPWYSQVHWQNPQNDNPADGDVNDVAFPTTFYPGTTEQNDAAPIELHPGEATTANISLRSVRSVRLRIQNSSPGSRSAWLSQQIFDDFEMPIQAQTRFIGQEQMVVTGFAPGRYTVHFRAGEQPGAEQEMDLNGDMTLDSTAALEVRNATITGLARAEGATLNRSFVMFRDLESGRRDGAPIQPDGKFKVDSIPPGKYEVAVSNATSVYLVNMAASGAKTDGRTLTIPNGADVRMAMVVAKGVGHIEGTAMAGDKGEAGVLVLLVPEKPDEQNALFRRDQSDSDGTFTLPNVVPGRYTLVAIEDGWQLQWLRPEILSPYRAKGESVTIQPGGRYNFTVSVQKQISNSKMMVGH